MKLNKSNMIFAKFYIEMKQLMMSISEKKIYVIVYTKQTIQIEYPCLGGLHTLQLSCNMLSESMPKCWATFDKTYFICTIEVLIIGYY